MQAGNEGPGQTTRTVKTVQYKPQAASAKCWGHFHLRKVCLEVKGPDGKKGPQLRCQDQMSNQFR